MIRNWQNQFPYPALKTKTKSWLGLDVLSLVGPTGVQLLDICCSSVSVSQWYCCCLLSVLSVNLYVCNLVILAHQPQCHTGNFFLVSLYNGNYSRVYGGARFLNFYAFFFFFFVNLPDLSRNSSKMSIVRILFSNCSSFRFISRNKSIDHMFMPVWCKSFSFSCSRRSSNSVHSRI